MAVPKEHATIDKGKGGGEVRKIKIEDINYSDKKEERGGYTFEYPYQFELTCDKQIVDTRPSQAATSAKNWNKKFYVREKDGNKNVAFTMDQTLLAVLAVLAKSQDYKVEYPFDVNDLIGKEFDAVVVLTDEWKFVDWVATFEHHGISVPSLADLGHVSEGEKADAAIPSGDLPF